MGGRQVAVAGNVEYTDKLARSVVDRRGRAREVAVGLAKVLLALDTPRLPAGQSGADGVGSAIAFHPAGAWHEAFPLPGFDEAAIAPGLQQLSLAVGQQNQTVRIRKNVFVIGQHLAL